MNVLVITHHRLINRWSGAISRICHLSKELAVQGAQVTVLALISPRLKPLPQMKLRENCEYFESPNLLQWIDGFTSRLGFPAYSLASYLNSLLPLPNSIEKHFDAVISESHFLWTFAKRFKSTVKVLSAHNYELAYHENFFRPLLAPLKRAEQRALEEADLVVAVSSKDQREFEKIVPHKHISIVENGFDIYCSDLKVNPAPDFSSTQKRTALLLASHSIHNLKALKYLIPIFSAPSIAEKWCLWIVGDVNPNFTLPNNMLRFGTRNDLTPFFQNAEIALNPMLSGSGSNVKLIECLGNGCPVLTTPIGARGFFAGLSGLYVDSINNFQNRLLNTQTWQKPNPTELVSFQWHQLGLKYYNQIDSILKIKSNT